MSTQSTKRASIHLLNALSKSNVGTIAAQRAICKILTENGGFDLSVSATDPQIFKSFHPECANVEVYDPLHPNLGGKLTQNHLQWVCFTLWNLIILTSTGMLLTLGISVPNRRKLIQRLRKCDVFIDQNLELFKGTPISLSKQLIREKSRIRVFHNIFWSFRMFYTVWTIYVLKVSFKKKIVIGPASFGPFENLPRFTQWMVKYYLNRYADLILVREPCSAKFLLELGVKNCRTVVDAALLIKKNPKVKPAKSQNLTIGFAPSLLTQTLTSTEITNYTEAHVAVIDELIDDKTADRIILLPSSYADVSICKKIKSMSKNIDQVMLVDTEDLTEYESWITQLDLLITSRMHPSIVAARNYIPFAVIIYDHKQIGLLGQLGLQNYSIPIGEISYYSLREFIISAIENKESIKQHLTIILPNLQKDITARIMQDLLE